MTTPEITNVVSNALIIRFMQCRRPGFNSWVGRICWRRDTLPTPVFLGFPCGSAGKESAHNEGDLGSIPGLGRSPWRRERLPTPVFWPGASLGLYSPRGRKESDTPELFHEWQSPVCFRLPSSLLAQADTRVERFSPLDPLTGASGAAVAGTVAWP